MGKRLILVLALLFVVGIAVSAYAEVQNVKVSGDITMQAVSRSDLLMSGTGNNVITGTGYLEYGESVDTLLSHVRVRVDADLTDNVMATVRLINERTWNTETSTSNAVAIDLAYATLKEFLYSPLSLTVGRQELHYGNDMIIGDIDTNNRMAGHGTGAGTAGTILPKSLDDLSLRKSFDAVKAVLNYDPLVVDAVYARISKTVDEGNSADLYGVNANYAVDKNTTLEGYYWLKVMNKIGPAATSPLQSSTDDTVNVVGGRVSNNSIKDLSLGLEAAYQFGQKVTNSAVYANDPNAGGAIQDRRAFAIQFLSSYSLADLVKKVSDRAASMKPMLSFNYTLLSGGKYHSTGARTGAWDPMYENQAGGTLFNKLFGYSNCHIYNVGASAKVLDDVKLAFDWYYLALHKELPDADLSAVSLTGIPGDPTYGMIANKSALGNEFDANLTYDYTEDVQFGLNAAWFVPGDAFNKVNRKTASQIIGSMKVTF